jgi:hypothetical protein
LFDRKYANAYMIYDYVDYQFTHNTTIQSILNNNDSYPRRLRDLASTQQWAFYGNKTSDGGIRTIAGQTLAWKVLSLFEESINAAGDSSKLNLLFGDYPSMTSFFSLASIMDINSNFYGLPEYGSSMVFELYSVGSADNTTFPGTDELWVEFYFRNGTNSTRDLQAFPIFKRGPSETAMRWSDFQQEMDNIRIASITSWCSMCRAQSLFCWDYIYGGSLGSGNTPSQSDMTPQVAGVIGAAVTLGVLAIFALLAMLVGGVRFHRVSKSKKSDLGGFKGSAKLASDADLALPKAAAAAGTTEEGKARERVGSWELKDKDKSKDMGPRLDTKFDDDNISINPFGDPVKPDERV